MKSTTGKGLAKKYNMNLEKPLYRKNGTWFHMLDKFPTALMDENGYIPFGSEEEMDQFFSDNKDNILWSKEKNWISVKDGISKLKNYEYYPDKLPTAMGVEPDVEIIEGAEIEYSATSYERDPRARKLCIDKWGADCVVCGINFGRIYGEIGLGYIHVHHLVPLGLIQKKYRLNAEKDLRPVCPNCHAMLHRRSPPLSVEELRQIIQETESRRTGA